ncbi:hypothetical protein OH492_16150 [Vibrio chagasii]|nr:hypothetical protein [Vibrio chagasii]
MEEKKGGWWGTLRQRTAIACVNNNSITMKPKLFKRWGRTKNSGCCSLSHRGDALRGAFNKPDFIVSVRWGAVVGTKFAPASIIIIVVDP